MCKLATFSEGKQVADIKLAYIKNIVSEAANCKHIRRIMLFGSSLEERCTDLSDIDTAIFGDLTKSRYYSTKEYRNFVDHLFDFDFHQDYDIFYFKAGAINPAPILGNISHGLEIYKREDQKMAEQIN